ncbi:hypothetical protein SNOG_05106 [Parastagonospora nodorum SN15]|uniref:Uncharacterized protein n=1 Tax=Phaeosphaeria nodorum (strain SN15 / ATCC MYA-4574 / FGSC 10173) TaxID=321614 RepID=Q0UT08_PHANO|nr:hypothetical protein SNOG_05106 [Parastagonospora nodorum SN15]EAT87497.2 hypothetical protein SNOG_05106 [Parastagonospora nodorum SN15]
MFNVRSIVLLVISYVVIPRLTFLPQGFHTLLMLFGPFLIPRVFDWFSTARATSRSAPVRPTPPRVQKCAQFTMRKRRRVPRPLATPDLCPKTSSCEHKAIYGQRPAYFSRGFVTCESSRTRMMHSVKKFASPNGMHNRLLYLVYGPDALLNCVWCTSSKGNDQNAVLLVRAS